MDPVCFRLPQHLPSEWEGRPAASILLERFDRSRDFLASQLAAGTIVDDDGQRITATTPAHGGLALCPDRPLPEPNPPSPSTCPSSTGTTPSSSSTNHTSSPPSPAGATSPTPPSSNSAASSPPPTTRRRSRHHPAHRLDRLTAGVLLFTLRKDARGPYQTPLPWPHPQKPTSPSPHSPTPPAAPAPFPCSTARL
ncbi:MAG: hypothetical protein U1U88_001553 [Lawsonella clevelandensis]